MRRAPTYPHRRNKTKQDHGATPEELAAVVEFVEGLLQ